MEKTLIKVAWIIFSSLIIGALITMVEQPFKSLMCAGVGIADVLVVLSIFYHDKKA
jgi:hypothetical protein